MTCRVISFFSTKGGVGKTLIATNLAAALRMLLNAKTAFVSLDPSHEDATIMLGPASAVQRVTERFTSDTLPAVIARLRTTCRFVIVDAGAVVNELSATAFEQSNLILLVTTPDVVSLGHTKRAIQLLTALKIPMRMIKVVLNRADSHGNVRSRDIRASCPVDILAEIPSDGRTVGLSVNKSLPFTMSGNGARIQEAFRKFARALIDTPALYLEQMIVDRATLPAMSGDTAPLASRSQDGTQAAAAQDPIIALKQHIHAKLIERFDLKRVTLKELNDPLKAKELKARTEQVALDLIAEEGGFIASREQRAQFVKEVVDDTLGLGPLEDLMADPEVSDILVNAADQIYIEKHGKLSLTSRRFLSNDQILTVIERIIAPLGRRIDESAPMVDARLPDGSRVNAIIPPLSIKGPMLSIRKFSRERFTMDDLIRFGTLTRPMTELLAVCVKARKNLIVSGGTGSGKTTILNALSSFIPENERIVTIEDAAELRLDQEHWVPLEARQANIEGKGAVTIRQLFRNTLRMRPDRVIIGECRGDETLDMLQAMNTGHDGSLTTIHANSPEDVIARLDSLVLMSRVELPVRAIREQIASAIHLIVHVARFPDGSRKITHITELTGIEANADITFRNLFVFHQRGVGPTGDILGEFKPTGQVPTFLEDVKEKGFLLDESLFHIPASTRPVV